jgi:hypothetical protein
MTRIYENRGYWWRQTVSMAVVIVVAIYGVWELWSAAFTPAPQTGMGQLFGIGDDRLLFGIAFVGGGVYALWQLINDAADTVVTLDVDEAADRSVVSLWRPFWTERLKIDVGGIRNWRFYVKVGNRNMRTFLIYADHPGYPRPLQFDLRKADIDGLRKIAPEAVAEYEQNIGRGGSAA